MIPVRIGCDEMKRTDQPLIGCVILAAGNSTRFGNNKLLAQIEGRSMIEHAFEVVPAEQLCAVSVITQYESISKLASDYGFECVINRHPELGISRSVILGVQSMKDSCDGILFLVADQPWLKRESISEILETFRNHPGSIVCISSGGKRGNPCLFPKGYFEELCSLSGDKGGRSVIERHKDNLILFEVDENELTDVDTPDDIAAYN